MPQRIVFLWSHMGGNLTVIWTTVSAAAGGLSVLAMNAEGWSAAIGAIGFGIAALIVRTAPAVAKGITVVAPALADAITRVGFAYAEFRGKLKRELAQVDAKAEVAIAGMGENREAIEQVRRQAAEMVEVAKAEAERIRVEAIAKASKIEEDAADKRHALDNRLSGQLLLAHAEIAELKARFGITDATHAEAINILADNDQRIAEKMKPPVPVDVPHLEASPEVPPR